MWGLDMTEGRLRLVHVVLRHRGAVLTHAVRIPVEPGSTDQHLAETLRRAVEGSDVQCRQIALCLPAADGAIIPVEEDGFTAGEDFVSLDFTTTGGRRFLVRGRRAMATRLAAIANQAGLEPVCITPLQAALAVSGDFFLRRDEHPSRVAVFVGHTRVHMLRSCEGVVRTCRSAPRLRDAEGYDDDVADMAVQFFSALNATANTGPWPDSCDIFADGVNAEQLRRLSDRLGVSCRAASPAMRSGLTCDDSLAGKASAFAAAAGAALTALGLPDIKVDLSSEVFDSDKPRHESPNRVWAVSVVVLAIAALALILVGRISLRMELSRLENRYEAVKPRLEKSEAVQTQWSRMRNWLSVEDDGARVAQQAILDKILELFPDPAQAYVTDLDLDARAAEVQINVKGRSAGSEPLHECITRLNETGLFQARLGLVSDVEQAKVYPKKYSIPMTYTAAPHDQEP